MTPAEQIRAALDLGLQAWRTTPVREKFLAAFAALDVLQAERDDLLKLVKWNEAGARLEERVAALEAEHADRVWLTRDEAREIRRLLRVPNHASDEFLAALALLDERLGGAR